MLFNRSSKKKMSFERFLSYEYAGDYINQTTPYAEQIEQAARAIREADYVLLGAGAGMSTAAGAKYGGKFFEENFAEFQKIYGKGPYMQDMYSAGFYPFPDQESKWGLWSHLALLAGADLDVTPLHRTLLDALKGKKLFLLSTNADHQFEKAGLPVEQIFATQGSYKRIQCARGCHPKTYDAVELFRERRKNPYRAGAEVPGLRRTDGDESARGRPLRAGRSLAHGGGSLQLLFVRMRGRKDRAAGAGRGLQHPHHHPLPL